MTRKIIRLWVEYESDASLHRYIEPISPAPRTLIEEIFRDQMERNNQSLRESIISARNDHITNMKYISRQRMDEIEEIIKKIDLEYQENQDMTKEEREESISDVFG